MPSQEAEAKSAECSVASPKPWSGTTMGGSEKRSTSVTTLPCTAPVPYLMSNWPPVSCVHVGPFQYPLACLRELQGALQDHDIDACTHHALLMLMGCKARSAVMLLAQRLANRWAGYTVSAIWYQGWQLKVF